MRDRTRESLDPLGQRMPLRASRSCSQARDQLPRESRVCALQGDGEKTSAPFASYALGSREIEALIIIAAYAYVKLMNSKTVYLDAFSGLSGDMIVGALIDAGADATALDRAM